MEPWLQLLKHTGSHEAVFNAFIESDQAQLLLASRLDSKGPWPPGHFYSPLTSRSEIGLDLERLYAPTRQPAAIALDIPAQLTFLQHLARHVPAFPFPDEKSDGLRYFSNTHSYNYGDAIIYWAILNFLRPSQIIEVGCGSSSCLALDCIDILTLNTACTFIDPHPEVAQSMFGELPDRHQLIASRIQDVDLSLFGRLGENDILFIDSTHVLKTGSDVHHELTAILPILRSGTWIHFHDMFAQFEYPAQWVVDNWSWNELYAVQLFLMHNHDYEICLFPHHLATQYRDEVTHILGAKAERFLLNPGGGLWIRKK